MTESQPPSYMDDQCYSAVMDRRIFDSLICTEGVANTASGQMLVSGGGTSVSVSSGYAWIRSDSGGAGVYFVHNTTGAVARNITNTGAAHTAAIVAVVFDDTYDTSGQYSWQLAIIQTYTPGGTLPAYEADADYATGGLTATSNHNGMILLATIAVNASGTITSITDERPQAGFCPGFMSSGSAPDLLSFSGADGTFNKATYPNLKAIKVRLWGQGGGGGGINDTDPGESASSGGGGGGGYTEQIVPVASIPAGAQPVQPGFSGGAGGTPGNSGQDGEDSTFLTFVAKGGRGGSGDVQTTTNSNSSGGAGGSAIGGQFNVSGGDGGNGLVRSGDVVACGWGGNAGGGGGGTTRPPNGSDITGRAGAFPGGGGSGCWSQDSADASGDNGGAAAAGLIVIELLY